VHGTAHWATKDEIVATGLLPRPGKPGAGVYVGGWTDARGHLHYLRHNGPEHIAGIAPTRSGKGVGLVILPCFPGLTAWRPEGRALEPDGAWRQQNVSPVYIFNPPRPRTAHPIRSTKSASERSTKWATSEPGDDSGRPGGQGPGGSLGRPRTPSLPARSCT
jgi:type IV secretory pathway TraG/TraD family ATPase VirD4